MLELQLGTLPPDPAHPVIWEHIARALGLQKGAKVEKAQGFSGGLNDGVWNIKDAVQDVVLKLVKYKRGGDADRLISLARKFPGLLQDSALAFATKVLRCCGSDGQPHSDIIVMRRAIGEPLNDIAAHKVALKRVPDMMMILERLGRFLAEFHARYSNLQHGDFQPTNVFYCEASDHFTMIDVADLGPRHEKFESDVDHFVQSIGFLAISYGDQFEQEGVAHFKSGYAVRSRELGSGVA